MLKQPENSPTCTKPDGTSDPCGQYRPTPNMARMESTKNYGNCPPKIQPLPPYPHVPTRTVDNPCNDVIQDGGRRPGSCLPSHAECCVADYRQKVEQIKNTSYCQRCDDPTKICEYPTVNMFDTSARRKTCTKNYDPETCMLAETGERQRRVTFADDATKLGESLKVEDGLDGQGAVEGTDGEMEKWNPCGKNDCPVYRSTEETAPEKQEVCTSLVHRGEEMNMPHPKCLSNGERPEKAAVDSENVTEKGPVYPWQFPTEEYKRVCGHGVPKKAQRNNRALEQEGKCPIPFVNTNDPKTSDYYKTCKLPSRFEYPSCFTNFGCQLRPAEHPFYRTTTKDYGWYQPNVHSVPVTFNPRSQTFSKAQAVGGMYRNYGLNLLS